MSEDPNTFLPNLISFCVDSAMGCFSGDRGEFCLPVGLTCVSALFLLLSCIRMACQRCKHRRGHAGDSTAVLYCFLGNVCGTVGAVLSKQLQIQILMGLFATGVDALHMITCCYPLCLCWNSHAYKRQRMMRRRRRQNLLAVCVLTVLAGGLLRAGVSHGVGDGPHRGRSLLQVAQQDHTEILGYILGLLSFVIASTSRFPALHRACRGPPLTGAHVFSTGMCSLAGALYAAAIFLCDTRIAFLLRVLPWLLSALCAVALDLLILLLHWYKMGGNQRMRILSSDTESLLGESGASKAATRNRKVQVTPPANFKFGHFAIRPFSAKPKNVQMGEMGRYMDVTVPPARKICFKEATVSNDKMDDYFLKRTVKIMGINVFCPSDTSCDSSVVSSDLELGLRPISHNQLSQGVHIFSFYIHPQALYDFGLAALKWDFEAGHTYLEEPNAKKEGDEFPLQPWPSNSETCNLCTYAMSGLQQSLLSNSQEHAVDLAK